MKQMLRDAEPYSIIAIHNHPGSSAPSLPDIMACKDRKYKYGLVACHDGKIYKYAVDESKFNKVIAHYALERLAKSGYTKEVEKMFTDSGVEMKVL